MILRLHQLTSRAIDVLVWCLESLSTLAMIVIVFAFGWLVFGRYVLNDTPTWVEHVAILLIAMITFFMMAANERRGANLAVGVLTERLPPRLQTWVLAMVDGFVAVFGVTCAVYGLRLALFNANVDIPMLGIPEGVRALPLLAGGAVLAVVAAHNAVGRFVDPASVHMQSDESVALDNSKLDLEER